jgi:hypothetical protein
MSQTSQMTIAELNDQFRQHNLGAGQVVLTLMVSTMPIERKDALLEMVKDFNDFTEGNDPHKEHDFGIIEFQCGKYFWKIDYYDTNYKYESEDPANSAITRWVLTIMHSSEY